MSKELDLAESMVNSEAINSWYAVRHESGAFIPGSCQGISLNKSLERQPLLQREQRPLRYRVFSQVDSFTVPNGLGTREKPTLESAPKLYKRSDMQITQ